MEAAVGGLAPARVSRRLHEEPLLLRLLRLLHSFILHLFEMLFSSDLFCTRQEPQDAMGKPQLPSAVGPGGVLA